VVGAAEGANLILVTGAGGQLGRAVCEALGERAVGLTRDRLDIIDALRVRAVVDDLRPIAIVNAAAYTAVDKAETDRDAAHAVNVTGAAHLAHAAASTGSFLVHVSTDMVFDGTLGRPYVEGDEPNPTSAYGETKLEGERAVGWAADDVAIVRTSWVYSPWAGFVRALLEDKRLGPIHMVTDIVGSPTWVRDLAAAIVALVDRPTRGVFHVAGGGACSRYEEAVAALEEAGRDTRSLSPVTWESYRRLASPSANRGANTALEGRAWAAAGFSPLRPWRDALTAVVPEIVAGLG
jgi:dTDP-4-dehydrorhamnose reductase